MESLAVCEMMFYNDYKIEQCDNTEELTECRWCKRMLCPDCKAFEHCPVAD